MKNNNISEEIISGWRREFDLGFPIGNTNLSDHVNKLQWQSFLSAKTSSHERILEIQRESDNHNKSFLNMFEQNEEKAKRILELEREIDRIRKRGINEAMGDMKTYYEEKLTKRDELLKEALPYIENADDCELSIGEKTINTEKWIKNYKQMEREK